MYVYRIELAYHPGCYSQLSGAQFLMDLFDCGFRHRCAIWVWAQEPPGTQQQYLAEASPRSAHFGTKATIS